MYRNKVKRILDAAAALLALAALSPVFLLTALAILVFTGKPVFFRQARVGKGEKTFMICKFRTLKSSTPENGLSVEEGRLTCLGRFLRSTGLDELPELVNILRGDMSFVGPRPLYVEYLPYYTDAERKRFAVRGGLVPPEVLFGDVMPTWSGQLEYEAYYAQFVSFLLDVRIILSAARGVLRRNRSDYGGYDRRLLSDERKAAAGAPPEQNGQDRLRFNLPR